MYVVLVNRHVLLELTEILMCYLYLFLFDFLLGSLIWVGTLWCSELYQELCLSILKRLTQWIYARFWVTKLMIILDSLSIICLPIVNFYFPLTFYILTKLIKIKNIAIIDYCPYHIHNGKFCPKLKIDLIHNSITRNMYQNMCAEGKTELVCLLRH